MKMEIDTNQLILYGLDIEQFMLLKALYEQKGDDMQQYFERFGTIDARKIKYLVDQGFIRTTSSGTSYSTLRLVESRFMSVLGLKPADAWITEWFDLWPKGVRTGGYYIRTDSNGCKIKLERFMRKYPEFTSDIIIEATRRYLAQRKLDNYEYTKLAPNFIEHRGVSVLAGECENVLNNRETERPKIVQGDLFGSNEL